MRADPGTVVENGQQEVQGALNPGKRRFRFSRRPGLVSGVALLFESYLGLLVFFHAHIQFRLFWLDRKPLVSVGVEETKTFI